MFIDGDRCKIENSALETNYESDLSLNDEDMLTSKWTQSATNFKKKELAQLDNCYSAQL